MSAQAKFEATPPKNIEFTLTATMSLEHWLQIKEAIEKGGAATTYGPTGWLHSTICSMITQSFIKISEKSE
ncbi:MAG: hypothetical protein WC829_18215 [Hyphomicrobium sp.]|jgi:hypothetical protein